MMQVTSRLNILKLLLLAVWSTLAIIVTTQSDQVPLVHLLTSSIGSTAVGAAVGHAGLFAVLTLAAYLVFSLLLRHNISLWLAMTLVLCLGLATELSQLTVPGRDMSLSDLLANGLGVFLVGFLVASISPQSRQTNTQ